MALFRPCSKSTKVSAGQSFFCSSSRVMVSPGRCRSMARISTGCPCSLIFMPFLRSFPVAHPQSSLFWTCMQCLCFLPSALWAGDSVIIGATPHQERFLTCVTQISADDLRDTPHSDERLTVVVLEHQKFLGMREAF